MKKNKVLPVPPGCEQMPIRVQKSNCTGEAVVGFYDEKSHTLKYSEFAADEKAIKAFYAKYGREKEYVGVL